MLDLQFRWTPGRLKVIEKSDKKGRDSTKSYTLEVSEHEGGLALEYRDFHFTGFGGLDLEDPAVRAELAEIEKTVGMLQLGFRVSSDGAFVGLLDMDSLIRGVELLQGPELAAYLRSLLENPQLRGMLEQSIAKPWQAWVGVWIGLEAASGQVVESESEVEVGGTKLSLHLRHEYLGADPSRPGHVLLRYAQRTNDARIMADEAQDRLLVDYERVVDVSLDPRTMVPAWAKDSIRGREPGLVEAVQSTESHEWTFEAG